MPVASGEQVLLPYEVGTPCLETTAQNTAEEFGAVVDSRGKHHFTIAVDNQTNQSATVRVYGSYTPTMADRWLIGSFTVLANSKSHETMNDYFPFLQVSRQHTTAPSDNPAKPFRIWLFGAVG